MFVLNKLSESESESRQCKSLVTTPLMLCCVYTVSYMK